MTKIDDAYMLEINEKLDEDLLQKIYFKGFSRIPVYQGDAQKVKGFLMTKDLLLINPWNKLLSVKQLASAFLRKVTVI